jgi:hypothetical protein
MVKATCAGLQRGEREKETKRRSESMRREKDIQAWWFMPVISALGRLRQEDLKFKASLGYPVRENLSQNKEDEDGEGGGGRGG